MTFWLEQASAFLLGIVFTVVVIAVSAKPLMRWSMRRMMKATIVNATTGEKMRVTAVQTTDLSEP